MHDPARPAPALPNSPALVTKSGVAPLGMGNAKLACPAFSVDWWHSECSTFVILATLFCGKVDRSGWMASCDSSVAAIRTTRATLPLLFIVTTPDTVSPSRYLDLMSVNTATICPSFEMS